VPMLTLTMPFLIADRSSESATPDEPCRTKGQARHHGLTMRSWSRSGGSTGHGMGTADGHGERVDACGGDGRQASSGSVRTPGV
jgi:hypothetical protein